MSTRAQISLERAWRIFGRMSSGWPVSYRRTSSKNGKTFHYFVKVDACHLKEARAILQGKHWQGKNRCVHLGGDP
jgi:hypothetical protein